MAGPKPLIVGNPVLLVIDIQKSAFLENYNGGIPKMVAYKNAMLKARSVIDAARAVSIPVIFFQEAHRPNMIDFGRELDGTEDIHCVEGREGTEIADDVVGLKPDDYVIKKRRYSCFIGTDLDILLRGLKADTLVMVGGLTNVCVHYTFADAHQKDFYCRVVEDCVGGSDEEAHSAALKAMEYLQTGAVRLSEEIIMAFRNHKAAAA